MGNPAVRALVVSRFASMLGIATLSYGLMVFLATAGASQATVSIIGGMRFFAALLFGISGGAITGLMSKRSAMVTAYALQALACFILPLLLGTTLPALVVLIFLISALAQIVAPAVKAATALVSTPAQVAVVAAIISLAAGLGAAIGSAFFAPFLINAASLRTLIFASGFILAIGAVRALWVPQDGEGVSLKAAMDRLDWRASTPTLRRTIEWVLEDRALSSMVLVGALAVGLFEGFNTLIPIYIRDVLQANPALTVFILAPGGLGAVVGTIVGPWLMDRRGERVLALVALVVLTSSFVLFGLIDQVTWLFAAISPLRLLNLFGMAPPPGVQAAGMIAILTSFGSTAAAAAVQAYVNRYVFLVKQPSTFGMQSVIESAVSLLAVVGLGVLASVIGSKMAFIVAPLVLIALLVVVIQYGVRAAEREKPAARMVLRELFDAAPREGSPESGEPAAEGSRQ